MVPQHDDPVRVYLAKSLDTAAYSAVVGVVGVVLGVGVGLLLGATLNGAKYFLFVTGFLQMSVGVAQMWPTDRESMHDEGADPDDLTRIQAVVDRLLPSESLSLPPGERFEPGLRRFVSAVLLLAVSLSLEVVFGAGA